MALIICKDLTLAYDGHEVVSGLSFTVNTGDYLCIAGVNGSGKTTLMRTLLGLKSVSAGEIIFGDGLRRSEIGYLPQQTEVQRDFPASVREVVQSGCLNRMGRAPFYGKKERELANRQMERLGILNLAGRCYRELSGGQQQRVLLARALCATSKLLLLDEPVSGLDPVATQELYALIQELNRNDQITVIMVTHDVSAVVNFASHILHINNKPLFFGKTEDYVKTDIGRAFIGMGGGADE
jgi:zinc transport system ATP-binding protein